MIAVKLAYDGTRFFGSQVQNDRRTVEGELRKHFTTRFVSRTDKGVSALGNVFFTGEDIRLRQYSFEEVWLYGKAERWKRPFKKRYSYFLSPDIDKELVYAACEILSGEHDFFNFCKKNRTREIDYVKKIDITPHTCECIQLDFVGESFLWEMVRRLAQAIIEIGTGERPLTDLENLLEERTHNKVRPAPPEYLLLVGISGFDFSYDEYMLKRIIEYFKSSYRDAFLKKNIFHHSLSFLRDLDV